MKLIISVLLITLGLGLIQSVVGPNFSFANTLDEEKFQVTKYLQLDEGKGERAAYFDNEDHSPIVNLIISVIDFAIIIIGTIGMILIIIAGFKFMFAQGNEQSLTEAKDMFKYALMGIGVALLSYTIATFVQSIFISV